MKIITRYLAYVAVLTLLFSSCSKEESTSPMDDPGAQSVDLTFGAVLNDLSNRAMASANKSHFDEIPTCVDDPMPAIAVLQITYDGQPAEDVGDDIVVDVLLDENGYFTDYSDDLKIPVPNNGSVEVTLESFKVFDGNVSEGKPYGELIWIAPIESEEGEFDGYVDSALPFSFDVEDGTKPYIDVEVLCFDRRMVNEYGYVFFDILPEVIYPLCLFVNYCDENGRHFVADYSVDLYFGTDDTGIQLYDHTEESAMATTGTNSAGNYFADPLCLVVPGRPANLPDDEPYLYLIIYPEDWTGTGDIDNTPVPVSLSWDAVEELLNSDGTTNEYLHLLIGECEDALEGDETIGGGNGGGNGNDDLDNDGVTNDIDQCPNTPEGAIVNAVGCPDSDGDGIYDNNENEGCINNPDLTCGETTEPVACQLSIPAPAEGCIRAVSPGDASADFADNGEFLLVESGDDSTPIPLFEELSASYGPTAGNFVPTISGTSFSFAINPNANFEITNYLVEIKDDANGDVSCVTSGTSVDGSFTYPIYVRVKTNICPTS